MRHRFWFDLQHPYHDKKVAAWAIADSVESAKASLESRVKETGEAWVVKPGASTDFNFASYYFKLTNKDSGRMYVHNQAAESKDAAKRIIDEQIQRHELPLVVHEEITDDAFFEHTLKKKNQNLAAMEFPNLRPEFSPGEVYYTSTRGFENDMQGPFTRDELLVCIRGPYDKLASQAEKFRLVQALEALRVRALQQVRVNKKTYIRRGDSSKWIQMGLDQSFRQPLEKARKDKLRDMMAVAVCIVAGFSLLAVGGHFVSGFIAEKTAGEPLAALRRGVNTVNTMPLINAIRRNNVDAVKSILAQHPQLANAEGSSEPFFHRPLVEATELRRSDCVELLLQHGAAVYSTTDDVRLLHLAIAIDRDRPDDGDHIKRMVVLLLAHGADVNARDLVGGTPLDCAMNLEPRLRIPELEAMLQAKGGTNSVNFRPRK